MYKKGQWASRRASFIETSAPLLYLCPTKKDIKNLSKHCSYIRVFESLNQLSLHPQLLLNYFQLELLCFAQRVQSGGVFNSLSDVPKLSLHVQKVLSHLFWRAIHRISGDFRDLKSIIKVNLIASNMYLLHKRTLGQMSPALMHSALMLILARVITIWRFQFRFFVIHVVRHSSGIRE